MKTKTIATLKTPLSVIEDLSLLPEILGMQIDKPIKPNLDQSVTMVKGNIRDRKSQLPGATGAGVIVGVIDVDFDINHPTFQNAAGTATRVIAVNDLRTGNIYSDETSNPNKLSQYNSVFNPDLNMARYYAHGTSVASIATGNGYDSGGNQSGFIGVAPGADILLVRVESNPWSTTSNIIEGLTWIAEKAGKKPWVANISLGITDSPRNGTGYLETAIQEIIDDNTTNDDTDGSGIVVVAAGNEGTYTGSNSYRGDIENLKRRIHARDIGSASKRILINADTKCPTFPE